jgi:tetratricopeptide (TPR) repeat protein
VIKRLKKLIFLALVLVAVLCFLAAYELSSVRSQQYSYYNAGLLALQAGDTKEAIHDFDKSLSVYGSEAQAGWVYHLVYGRPSEEMASLAHFYKGLALLQEAQAEQRPGIMGEAVDELEASLKINPGYPYADGVSPVDAARMNAEALTVKHNLELIFMQHPEQQKQNGNGQGQGNGPPQPAQPAPGNNPGNKPGHGNDNGI